MLNNDNNYSHYKYHISSYRTKDIVVDYFLDWQNLLDDLAILCVLLIIPFRILDSDNQWIFAALAFMFHGLRIFKYAIMFK